MDKVQETLNIPELMRDLTQEAGDAAKKQHLHFRYRIDGISHASMQGNPDELREILKELVDNAIQFTPEGGDVILSVNELMHTDDRAVLEFYVQDNGVGMSPIEQAAVLRRIEMDTEGHGLGKVKRYADQHDGSLSIESGHGMGTVIRLILPLRLIDKPENIPVRGVNREFYHFSGKRILLVEDHPLNMEIARDLLETVGVDVISAGNGQEAIDVFVSEEGAFDLILMDIRMPVMDGITASGEIRRLPIECAKTIPIIALTASAYEGDAARSRQADMDGAILKPIDPGKLYRVLRDSLF